MVMVYATGHLSGAHINPAVTLAFTLTRHFPARDALAYVSAQLAGAMAGALLLLAVWTDQPAELGATRPGGRRRQRAGLRARDDRLPDVRDHGRGHRHARGRRRRGDRHRRTVGLDALFGGPVTGASMNPARILRPGPRGRRVDDLWIYVAGPIVGALASGAVAYQLVRGEPGEVA